MSGLRELRDARRAADAAVAAHDKQAIELKQRAAAAGAAAERQAAEINVRDGQAFLRGEEAVGPSRAEQKAARLATAARAAVEIHVSRRPGLLAAQQDADTAFAAAALEATLTDQEAEQGAARKALGDLRNPLAELRAAEMLRHQLVGEIPPLDGLDPARLWSPRIVIARFLEAVPARLRPAWLTVEAIEAEARRLADAKLADIEGGRP